MTLSMDVSEGKLALGFWQGSSENHEISAALVRNPERCGLVLSQSIMFITDDSSGLSKMLRARFDKKLHINAVPFTRAGTCSGTRLSRIGLRLIGG